MKNSQAVQHLVPILRAANPARPVFLLGAGASFSSGVPLADESVRRLAKRVYADRVLGGAIPAFRVKTSEWERWLRSRRAYASRAGFDRADHPLAVPGRVGESL